MRPPPKPRIVLDPIRIENRVINGQTVAVKILPPRPAQGAWFAESEWGISRLRIERTTENPC